MHCLIGLDEQPGVLHLPVRPVLLDIQHLDVLGLDGLLLVLQDLLQETEAAGAERGQPFADFRTEI